MSLIADLSSLVAAAGSHDAAAAKLGVPRMTLWRWLSGRSVPRGLYAERVRKIIASVPRPSRS